MAWCRLATKPQLKPILTQIWVAIYMASLGRIKLIDVWDQLFQCLYLFSVLFLFDIQAHTQTTAYY